MDTHVFCNRKDCISNKWGIIGEYHCELRSIRLNAKGTCEMYVKNEKYVPLFKGDK